MDTTRRQVNVAIDGLIAGMVLSFCVAGGPTHILNTAQEGIVFYINDEITKEQLISGLQRLGFTEEHILCILTELGDGERV